MLKELGIFCPFNVSWPNLQVTNLLVFNFISLFLANPLICNSTDPPPLELIVPIARKLSGSNEDQSGVQVFYFPKFWLIFS